ncbi:folylpolyglutamate synthase/dihydrofolate synthase family protein [soil metagenome]
MSDGEAAAPPAPAEYQETLGWLFGTQLFGIKLGLESIQRLLRALQVPGAEQRFIHVAGTNGKGSVCAMIDSICRTAGYRTGLFTSPHLVTYRERIQVNGEMIPEPVVAKGLTLIRELVRDWEPHPTFFEITTALALWHFKREACELVVLETGMGGRLDATNAVEPVVSVITPIDLDHQKWLGHTLAEIAVEKAGIIKPGVPVVCAPQPAEAEAVIRAAFDATKERRPPGRRSATGAAWRAPLLEFVTDEYGGRIGLCGSHQRQNAALAVAALRAAGVHVEQSVIDAGLGSVKWPARFQRWNDRIAIDGAHNPAGARVAAATWQELFGEEKAVIVLGLMRDKDAAGVVRELAPIAAIFILPQFRGERVLPPDELQQVIATTVPGIEALKADSAADALRIAQEKRERVLVAGSLHLAGEALAVLSGRSAAFQECTQ